MNILRFVLITFIFLTALVLIVFVCELKFITNRALDFHKIS